MIEDEKNNERTTNDEELDEYTRRVCPWVRWVWFVAAAWLAAIGAWISARGRAVVACIRARVARDAVELPETMRSGAEVAPHEDDMGESATPPEESPQHCDTLSP